MKRVVVVQNGLPDDGGAAHVDDVLDGAVAPANPLCVLGDDVLGVVDHDVGVAQELDVAGVVAVGQHVTAGGERGSNGSWSAM